MASERNDGNGQANRSPDALVAEIERTREELAVTLDAIVDRVSPKRAASRGVERAKELAGQAAGVACEKASLARDAVEDKVAELRGEPVRQRPSPAAVIDPVVAGPERPALPPTSGVRVPVLAPRTSGSGLPADGVAGTGIPREALVGAAAASLVALWLLRRRRGA